MAEEGERSYCLLDFFASNAEQFHGGADRYLVIMDESHVTPPSGRDVRRRFLKEKEPGGPRLQTTVSV